MPPTPLRLATRDDIDQSDYAQALNEDLRRLSEAAKREDFSDIETPNLEVLFGHLIDATAGAKMQDAICQDARHIASILQDYSKDLFIDPDTQTRLHQHLQSLANQIGSTPTISGSPVLPEQAHLPPQIAKSQLRYQEMVCEDKPKRGKNLGEIHFFTHQDGSSARLSLEAEQLQGELSKLQLEDKILFLNLTDFSYYEFALLHADHMTPSEELINRQYEIIQAMNWNPKFKAKMLDHPDSEKFFREHPPGSGVIAGTYWYYMAFHNDKRNVWCLLASQNVGSKHAANPMEWLGSFSLGQEFLGTHQDLINRSDLLYTDTKGDTLKDAFVSWFMKKKEDQLHAAKACNERFHVEMASIRGADDLNALRYQRLIDLVGVFRKQRDTFEKKPEPGDAPQHQSPSPPQLLHVEDIQALAAAVDEEMRGSPTYQAASVEAEKSETKRRRLEKMIVKRVVERRKQSRGAISRQVATPSAAFQQPPPDDNDEDEMSGAADGPP